MLYSSAKAAAAHCPFCFTAQPAKLGFAFLQHLGLLSRDKCCAYSGGVALARRGGKWAAALRSISNAHFPPGNFLMHKVRMTSTPCCGQCGRDITQFWVIKSARRCGMPIGEICNSTAVWLSDWKVLFACLQGECHLV